MNFLELHKVSKRYGEGDAAVRALEEIDLSVDEGQFVAIMGPSGSGKSTLLTIAGSLEDPTSGDVLVNGASLSRMSRTDKARLRRRTIGYVFQDFNLLSGLTALDGLDLADRAGHFPDELSGGERQRVSIARALVGERHLLLADEPSGALDSANGEAVMQLIAKACDRGVAAVVVTHDAHLATWADRIVFLRDGHIVDHVAPTDTDALVAPSLRP